MTESSSLKVQEYPANYYASLLAGLVHKLNNIVTVMTGHSGLLLLEPNLTEQIRQPVRRISQAAETLSMYIDAANSASKAPALKLEPIVVSELLAALVVPVGLVVQRKCRDALTLVSDRQKLKTIFEQILQNAIEADANTETISAFREKAAVCLIFRDDGQGIKSEVIGRVFDPFFTTRIQRGQYGLGLFRARGELLRMNGAIAAVSDGETYTEILVRLPAA